MLRVSKLLLAALLLALTFAVNPVYATEHQSKHTVKLSEQQQQELAAIYRVMFDNKRVLIAKYVEFGVISQEHANKWLKHLDERYERLAKNGFIPPTTWKKCKEKKDKKSDD